MRCAGVEGTGSYGAGLARHLKAAGIAVMEVERPKRRHLHRRGNSDPIDAEQSGEDGALRRGRGRAQKRRRLRGDGPALRGARRSAVKAACRRQICLRPHSSPPPKSSAGVYAGSRRRSWWRSRPASRPAGSPKMWRRRLGSR